MASRSCRASSSSSGVCRVPGKDMQCSANSIGKTSTSTKITKNTFTCVCVCVWKGGSSCVAVCSVPHQTSTHMSFTPSSPNLLHDSYPHSHHILPLKVGQISSNELHRDGRLHQFHSHLPVDKATSKAAGREGLKQTDMCGSEHIKYVVMRW